MLCLVGASLFIAPAARAGAATIVVNETEDENIGDNDCSLREAVASANNNTSFDACTAGIGFDKIVVPAGIFPLHLGELHLGEDAVIEGAGKSKTVIQLDQARDPAPSHRILSSDAQVAVVTDLTIAHGESGTFGGGIGHSTGQLFVRRVILRDNEAAEGAAIWSSGTVQIEDSIIRNNSATENGGGVYGSGIVGITRTTLSGNEAAEGGGLFIPTQTMASVSRSTFSNNLANGHGGGIRTVGASTLVLENSTLGGNTADAPSSNGGGLSNSGSAKIWSSTITGNTSRAAGSGVFSDGYAYSDITMNNSIVSDNTTISGATQANCEINTIEPSSGYNLENGTTCDFTESTDLDAVDPKLAPLGSYGGPTKTHALKPTSPAVDGGTVEEAGPGGGCRATDQRGVDRPQDGPDPNTQARCDVGAFELRVVSHERVVSFDLSRHLRVAGRVSVPDGFNACRKNVRVLIQRDKRNGWETVADPRTNRRGRYSSSLPDDTGRYRAHIGRGKVIKGDLHKCLPQTSEAARHRH
ncbi:MAG: CSLREA domain-containing protein [Actinomycetota bacterium]|nr:CSLREA domain-containing protein [Actinomycetota bacterium]